MGPCRLAALTLLALLCGACLEQNTPPEGLRQARPSGGPRIIFDLEERPFPEIPFPNDLATLPNPGSPTGLRLNVSEQAPTQQEVRVRQAINTQSGFGVYSPITVRFDAPLDVHELVRRHQEPVPDFDDDAVYLINVDRQSPGYGELVLLDMGRGNFPLTLQQPDRYFENDPRSRGTNLLFETVRERDLNDNGILDPIEDTDDDGVWDRPNVLDEGADPRAFGQLLDFYERETHTLIMRPTEPLRPATTYAVVLSQALRGEGGLAVESPFDFINHTRQTRALEPLRELLPAKLPARFDTTLSQVRFAWTFTTRTPTKELETIRAGLYGHGPLARLAQAFPAELMLMHDVQGARGQNEPMLFRVERIIPLLIPLISSTSGQDGGAIGETFKSVDYVVSGSFRSPLFIADQDGLAAPLPAAAEITPGDHQAIDRLNAANEDDIFTLDVSTGEALYSEDEVPFLCVVPKPTPRQSAPFPTIVYSHAIGSTRLEGMVFAGAMAKLGMATCTIDAVGHGIAVPSEFDGLLEMLTRRLDLPNLDALVNHHRARDMDGDGAVDSGGDYFTTDLLRSRDMIRQTTVDQLQFVRILRSFDGTKRFPKALDTAQPYVIARQDVIAPSWDADGDGREELAGDFNADGVVDFGGNAPFVAWGTSLGGIQTSVLAGIEPTIVAMASNAGGGGLLDIATRTSIANVRVGSLLRTFGPLIVGQPKPGEEGTTELAWILPEVTRERRHVFAEISGLEDGDSVVLRNLERDLSPYVELDDLITNVIVREGRFRIGVATDGLSTSDRRALQGVSGALRVTSDIMGCVAATTCGPVTCPENHYCSAQAVCEPLGSCPAAFDASEPLADPEQEAYIVRAPLAYGDPLELAVYDVEGKLKTQLNTLQANVVYDNLLYPKGSPLSALADGWGIARQTPRLRRFMGIGQMLLEPADPAIWATHYQREPLKFPYEEQRFQSGETRALIVGTLGDQTVPISNALALARAAGALDTMQEDARYGMTRNQYLVQNYVYEGIYWLDRFPAYPNSIFDPDDLDEGQWRSKRDGLPSPESDAPLRAQVQLEDGGIMALRLPYLDERGEHTFNAPNPALAFDIHTYMLNQVGWYLAHGGRALRDDICFEADVQMSTCEFFDPETFAPDFD